MAYPATFDVQQPTQEFDKAQVALRIVIIILLGWLLDAVLSFAYLALPVIAAILISQKGAEQYLAEAEAGPTKWLRYLLGFYSYMALATDKMPTQEPEQVIQLHVQTTGSPTVGSTLVRIILGIPHAIVLGIVGIAFAVVWLIAAISILITGSYPDWAFNFIRGYLRWNARLLAYMAGLVDEYPPFSFQNGETAAPAAAPQPSAPIASEMPPEPPTESGGDAPPSQPTE